MDDRYVMIIRASGEIQRVPAEQDLLRQLQNCVGGCIEVVRLPEHDSYVMIIDEEGKLKNLPLNKFATAIATMQTDYIVGDACIVEVDGEELRGICDKEKVPPAPDAIWQVRVCGNTYSLVHVQESHKYAVLSNGTELMSEKSRRTLEERFLRHLKALCEMDRLAVKELAEKFMLPAAKVGEAIC